MKIFLFGITLGILVLILHYAGFVELAPFTEQKEKQKEMTPWISSSVPQITAKDLKGKDFSLENLRGKIVLLNFWASWCEPCFKEFPELVSMVKWGKGRVALFAVSSDSSKEDIKTFLKKMKEIYNVDWNHKDIHIIWDPQQKISEQFHTIKLPETFILNSDLQIIQKQVGAFSLKKAKELVAQVLAKETAK